MTAMRVKIDLFSVHEFVSYKLFKLNLPVEIALVFSPLIVVMVKTLHDHSWV